MGRSSLRRISFVYFVYFVVSLFLQPTREAAKILAPSHRIHRGEAMKRTHAISRRHLLQGTVAAGMAAALAPDSQAAEENPLKGRIKQSIVYWCFNAMGDKWDAEKT